MELLAAQIVTQQVLKARLNSHHFCFSIRHESLPPMTELKRIIVTTELNFLFFPTGSPNLCFSLLRSTSVMGVDRRDRWTGLWVFVDVTF